MRKAFWIAAVLLGAAVLGVPPAHAADLPPPPLCAPTVGVPAVLWTTGGSCDAAFCFDDQQCRTNCPDALTASCTGGLCQYTFSGGSGINDCPEQRFCSDDSNCVYGTLQGSCVGGVCRC